MSYYTVYLADEVNERLRELAHAERRRPRSQAEILLEDAVRRAAADGDTTLADLATAFEAEGRGWFAEADSPSAGLVRRLILQTRGEAWLQAASRLRATATPSEAPHVEPSSPMG